MEVPEEYGGGGVEDFRYNMVIIEEIAAAGVGGVGLGITLHNDICLPYFLNLPPRSRGSGGCPASAPASSITAVAMTEPGIGSDLASMTTTARSATATTTSSTGPRRSSPTASTPTS